jgi:F-box interacting protein
LFISNLDPVTRSINVDGSLDQDDSAISIPREVHSLGLRSHEDEDSRYSIKGSCRGILVLRTSKAFYLWNPSTRIHKQIPFSPNDNYLNFFGFGYDHSTDDYLIISISHPLNLSFFSLRANTWNQIESTHDHYTSPHRKVPQKDGVGLLFNGAIHWFASRKENDLEKHVIVSFDLKERTLSDIHFPLDFDPTLDDCRLWVCRGFLSLWSIERSDISRRYRVVIWVMKEYKLHSSWTKTITLPIVGFLDHCFLPLCSTKSGHTVRTDYFGTGLDKYDDRGQELEYHSHRNRDHLDPLGYKVAVYTESLISFCDEQA